ncbi:MAG: hypothetical protein NT144_13010 [Bacteroidia bacterium]|nr:hypothetical protein [Bacteroidia bacterium]
MAICSKCRKRLIFWISLTIISMGIGLLLDLSLIGTNSFPAFIRIAGLAGVIFTHFLHLSVGMFMTFLGLLTGYPVTFVIITATQWLWVFLFVLFIEEKECLEKFGDDYREYRKNVPMFFGNPFCIIREMFTPINK